MVEAIGLPQLVAVVDPEKSKKRRKRRKKEVCIDVQKNCTSAELQIILTELDGKRPIMRSADGRRMRTQVVMAESIETPHLTFESVRSNKEWKIKRLLVSNYLEKSRGCIQSNDQIPLDVLPLEQVLALVEVIA